MKLLDVTCPHCGAAMKVTENAKTVHCEYCNHDFVFDDEVIHTAHHIEDAEQLGYDLEAGRRRYGREQENQKDVLQSGLCPHCGAAVFMDKAHTNEICYECHKEFNEEAAALFERAELLSEYKKREDALKCYDKALALQSNGTMLIKRRNKCKRTPLWVWLLAVVIIFLIFMIWK